MSKKILTLITLLALTLTLLTGCGTTSTSTTGLEDSSATVQTSVTSYPLTIKDDSGTEVTIPAKPQRIISFVPSSTETLFALGLEGSVVGVTKWDDYPQDVQQKVEYVFDDAMNPNVEQILKLNPDLIILGSQDAQTVEALRQLGIPVVKYDPQSLEATYQTIESFGVITDTSVQAQEIVTGMRTKEAAIEEKVATVKEEDRIRVWIEVSEDLYTPGQGTFMDELVTKAGGVNIAHDVQGWAQFSSEQVVAQDPQVIFTTYGYYIQGAPDKVKARSGWGNIDAVKNNRVYDLDSNLVNRPGPRIIDGMESMAKQLYPELFK